MKNNAGIQRLNPSPQWSDAVVHNSTAYFVEVPESGSDLPTQTLAVFQQAERTLKLVGSEKKNLLLATIYLKHMADRQVFNLLWQEWLIPGNAPARVCVSAELANPEYLLEISFVAAVA